MKKPVCLILAFLFLMMPLTACTIQRSAQAEGTPSVPIPSDPIPSSDEPEEPIPDLPKYVPGSIELQDQQYDLFPYERKYRNAYYTIWGEFTALLPEEEVSRYYDWFVNQNEATNHGEFQEEMLLVSFVKEFNISREDFDAAVEEFRKNNKNSTHHEDYEVPNADIIYTFDNEIINEYYRYA